MLNKRMIKVLTIFLLILLAISSAKAQIAIVNVEMTPETLLVGDKAECKVTLYNPEMKAVKVSSIQFETPYGISVEPKFVNVGYLAKQSRYDLIFYITAEKSGIYTVKIDVNTGNSSVTQLLNVFVEKDIPKVVLEPIKLNEVNNAEIKILSPIKIKNVVVEPLFDSTPKYLTFKNVDFVAKAKLKFYGKKQNYKFRISFYNGLNYHSYVQEIHPTFLQSKGLFLNVSTDSTIYLYDVVPVKISVSNLREDTIYEVVINATSHKGIFSNDIKIDRINPLQSKFVTIYYSPLQKGLDCITLNVSYKDEVGNNYRLVFKKNVEVLNETSVSVTNLEVDVKNEITVSGDISNNGKSEVYNVYTTASLNGVSKDYFIGSIDPSDFQSFSIPIKGNGSKVSIKVLWTNRLGKNFEITKTIEVKRTILSKENPPIWVLAASALVVIVFVALAMYSYRKNRKD